MERHAVNFEESQNAGEYGNEHADNDKPGENKKLERHKQQHAADEKNDKLPNRKRAKDFVFYVEKLWNGELLHFCLGICLRRAGREPGTRSAGAVRPSRRRQIPKIVMIG